MRCNQLSQFGVERRAVLGIDPVAILRFEMKTARACGNPDFTRHAMAVDDNFAAILELDFENAISRGFKIEVGRFQRLFDMCQRCICGQIECGLA